MDQGTLNGAKEGKVSSLSRRMSKVGLLAAMKTFTKPHFQRKKKSKDDSSARSSSAGGGTSVKQQSRSWDSGLCNIGRGQQIVSPGQSTGFGTVGSYKKIYWASSGELDFPLFYKMGESP